LITVGAVMQGVEYGIEGVASKTKGEPQITVYPGTGLSEVNVVIFISLGAL